MYDPSEVIPGVTHFPLPGPEGGLGGFVAFMDSGVERLRDRMGDDGVSALIRDSFVAVGAPFAEASAPTPALKFAAVSVPSSSIAPAAKNSHATQLRDEGGRWRTSLFRRVVNAQPKLEGARFFR